MLIKALDWCATLFFLTGCLHLTLAGSWGFTVPQATALFAGAVFLSLSSRDARERR